ncbi:multiple epidermal growth factor-like domains protein 10 [Ostrea edulis]|uniref:multiple epidermal growth factor-like domains protein 10 n=1 Tax=Ostrea edulis TaxID=37623 RepID=UPI0024AEEE1D|nr:multiple epidermal growth factor-like domains protein 10 [Ostrea edulis]
MDFNLFLCLIVWFLSPYIASSSSQLCGGLGGKVCCNGYIWNEAQNSCTRCRDGFYGRNCTIPCPYPTFGWDCQLECICSSEYCHHAYGCRKTPSEDYLSLHSIEISTIPTSASRMIYTEATTETVPNSTNIPQMNILRAKEKEAVNESYLTPLIAGIISVLIIAAILLILYVMTYLHKVTCIVDADTSSERTL